MQLLLTKKESRKIWTISYIHIIASVTYVGGAYMMPFPFPQAFSFSCTDWMLM